MTKQKTKLFSKILLGCMLASYLQLFGAISSVFAEEPAIEENLPVKAPVQDAGLKTETDSKTEKPVEPVELLSVPEEILPEQIDSTVEITKSFENSLNYNLTLEEGYLPEDFSISSIWYKDCEEVDGVINFSACSQIGTTEELIVSESGNYYVVLEGVSSLDNNLSFHAESLVYSVNLPSFDDAQLEGLNYNVGERFTLNYVGDTFTDALTASLNGEALSVSKNEFSNTFTIEGNELIVSEVENLIVQLATSDEFTVEKAYEVEVNPGLINPDKSTLLVTKDGIDASYVEAGSGYLNIVFNAYDLYLNKINIQDLERVDVRLNGVLLEGVDLLGDNIFSVERTAQIPAVENYNSKITVDVFDDSCLGSIVVNGALETNYCFSKEYSFVVYDTSTEEVENLVYVEKTNSDSVTISGIKPVGYGIKVNSTDSNYVVNPNDSTFFSFEIELAEGKNKIDVYSVKEISQELVFYSNPVSIIVEKDSKVSKPVWGAPAITLDEDNSATLHWTDPIYLYSEDSDFSHVNIYRSTIPNFVPNESNLIIQTHNPNWTDTGLNAGTTYYYAMAAVDDLGNVSPYTIAQSTGEILGEAASTFYTSSEETEWYEVLYAGKGEDVEIEDTEDSETESSENGDSENESETNDDSKDEEESSWKAFWNKTKEKVSSIAEDITDNIFVQICCGGIIIFLGLMILISVLVWLKEKIVDGRLATLSEEEEEAEEKVENKPKKKVSKSKK